VKRTVLASMSFVTISLGVLASTPAQEQSSSQTHPHQSVQCGQCHELVASAAGAASLGAACRQCHGSSEDSTSTVGIVFHAEESRDCLECHRFHEPESFTVGGEVFSFAGNRERARAHCATCHSSAGRHLDVSEGHQMAAEVFYHASTERLQGMTPSEGCLACHSWDGTTIAIPEGNEVPRFNEHASHPYGVTVRAGSGRGARRIRDELDTRLPLFGGHIECQTCHEITASTADYLRPYNPPTALCMGCHEFSGNREKPEAIPPLSHRASPSRDAAPAGAGTGTG
jgi:predicted CXXCH cytochrome family protein